MFPGQTLHFSQSTAVSQSFSLNGKWFSYVGGMALFQNLSGLNHHAPVRACLGRQRVSLLSLGLPNHMAQAGGPLYCNLNVPWSFLLFCLSLKIGSLPCHLQVDKSSIPPT
jgi:hypothetical protein